ncbi:hypothetical protein D3C73_1385110 [compost metagenome]
MVSFIGVIVCLVSSQTGLIKGAAYYRHLCQQGLTRIKGVDEKGATALKRRPDAGADPARFGRQDRGLEATPAKARFDQRQAAAPPFGFPCTLFHSSRSQMALFFPLSLSLTRQHAPNC